MHVCEDAGVTWEYWAKLDSDQDALELTATITALLAPRRPREEPG
jgi:hypothetical protein